MTELNKDEVRATVKKTVKKEMKDPEIQASLTRIAEAMVRKGEGNELKGKWELIDSLYVACAFLFLAVWNLLGFGWACLLVAGTMIGFITYGLYLKRTKEG